MITKQLGYSSVAYNPETGIFVWLVAYRKPWLTGTIATRALPNGYLYIKAGGKSHSASRLAIELVSGMSVPNDMVVDHINRNIQDNKISNLRVVTQKENVSAAPKRIGISGISGISIYNRPSGNGYMYRTRIGGKIMYYKTLDEAVVGYAKLVEERCQ